jgi:hypothetical protein
MRALFESTLINGHQSGAIEGEVLHPWNSPEILKSQVHTASGSSPSFSTR